MAQCCAAIAQGCVAISQCCVAISQGCVAISQGCVGIAQECVAIIHIQLLNNNIQLILPLCSGPETVTRILEMTTVDCSGQASQTFYSTTQTDTYHHL